MWGIDYQRHIYYTINIARFIDLLQQHLDMQLCSNPFNECVRFDEITSNHSKYSCYRIQQFLVKRYVLNRHIFWCLCMCLRGWNAFFSSTHIYVDGHDCTVGNNLDKYPLKSELFALIIHQSKKNVFCL